jgi:hypothetical protein
MGYLGDYIGRNETILVTVSIGALFALLQSLTWGNPEEIYAQIAIYRFFLGVLRFYRDSNSCREKNLSNVVLIFLTSEPEAKITSCLAALLQQITLCTSKTRIYKAFTSSCIIMNCQVSTCNRCRFGWNLPFICY